MIGTRTWTTEIFLTEGSGVTRARAVLHTDGSAAFEGTGSARSNPGDVVIPTTGDAHAVAEALRGLARSVQAARKLPSPVGSPPEGSAPRTDHLMVDGNGNPVSVPGQWRRTGGTVHQSAAGR